MVDRLTDAQVKALPVPATGNRITYDGEVKGFGVRITSAGARAFILNYRVARRERRITIGSFPDWKTSAAREEAKALKRRVDRGEDPMQNRQEARDAPTMIDLADRFEVEHIVKRRPTTARDYKAMLKRYIRPTFGHDKVDAVRTRDIEALHRTIAKTAPYMANRVVALLSKMFTFAIKEEMRPDNPVRGIERAPEVKRKKYLSPAEIGRLSAALAAHPERSSANAVRLLLLTGARRGEMLSATWDQFDLNKGIWVKPGATTKQKTEHQIPLSAPAIQLLSEMKAEADIENGRRAKAKYPPIPFLFPGVEGKPLKDIKRFWASVCDKAEINGFRVHDLRHTHASILVNMGLSLPIIGALLGHTQAATTHRYAHLMDDPLRAATERLGAIVTGAGNVGGEVVPLRNIGGKQPATA